MRLLILILLFFVPNVVFAEVYLLVNADNTIQSIDKENNAVLSENQRKVILEDDYLKYSSLTYPDNYYILKGKRLVLNAKKLEKESLKESKIRKKYKRKQKIQERMYKIAEEQLIKEGKIESEVE